MFRRKSAEPTALDTAIDRLHTEMAVAHPDSVEYAKTLKQLEKLYKLKAKHSTKRVSPDTLALIAGNIAVTLVIVGHERAHVVTTRALNFIQKPR